MTVFEFDAVFGMIDDNKRGMLQSKSIDMNKKQSL